MSHEIHVIKRNGERVPFDLQKWQAQIAKVCEGIADVSPSMIEIAAQAHFRDGMTTRELDEIALKSMINLIDEEEHPDVGNVNYQYVAGKQRVGMLRKDVYGHHTPPSLYEIVTRNVGLKLYTADLLQWYTKEEWDALDRYIDHDKDEELPYAAVDQLIEKYLIRNRATGKIVETPQVRYMIAAATMFHAEKRDRTRYVREFYQGASDGLFTLSTPVLAGLGTKTKQFSSCVLMRSDDTLKSIFATGQIMADYASKRAGIGLEIGRLRPVGAPIRDGEVMHTGIIPFLKKWYGDLRSCSQGGIRNASATITMPIWHLQFEDFIVLKNNKGTEETRVRHLDYAVMTSSMFWRRFKNKETITLFDPNQVPDLYEAFYSDLKKFEELYRHYEHQKGLRSRVVSAEDLFKSILVERTETGRIYIDFIDNVQRQTPFNTETHPIYQSNLCQEIFLPTKPFQTIDDENGRIALCTLSSINWGAFRHPDEMKRVCRLLVRGLHNLLQYQDFLSVHSYLSNLEFEPLGIGVTNLAYWHAKRRLKYGEAVALAEVKTWMEHQTFYLTQASMELAKEKGPCKLSSSTKYGQGIFPWECRAPGVDELTDFTPSSDLDWEGLRAGLRQYGIRNAVVSALPPVESSSVCINSTNGISMVKQMIVSKASKAGDFVQVVPEYKKLRHHYELLWSVPDCVNYLKTAAVLQAYVDQGISVDTFYSPRHFKNGKVDITLTAKNIMLAQKWGLKSLYYHLTEKQAALESVKEDIVSLVPVSSNLPASSQNSAEEDEDGCISCKL